MSLLHTKSVFFVFFCAILSLGAVFPVYAYSLPVASMVRLSGVSQVAEGMVIAAQEASEKYDLSNTLDEAQVYGVVAAQPPVVFATEGTNTSIITEGVAFVQVNTDGGAIARGDLLVTSAQPGVAMKASDEHVHVFAIALEALQGDQGVIQAEIGPERAQLLRTQKREVSTARENEVATDPKKLSLIRATIAILLVIGALGFLLYSFRSLLTHGVISIGRNPRAKGSIITFSFANFVFALILSAAVVFIAVAVLVLPL